MDFLSCYWDYHNCYEIPRNYAFWSGIGLLSSVIHRRINYIHGDIEIYPTEYIGLIGPQGSSKSTCCSFARNWFKGACPDLQIGPSRSSPESLVKIMSDDKFIRYFKNEKGDNIEVRPFAFFINEFKNFVGRSPFDMLTFLTDIYDVKAYDASTIVRGLEYIINPAISLLCCETPEWIIRNIKGDVISGGFGRRIVYVYETEDLTDKPVPIITPIARESIEKCKARLIDIKSVVGQYTWSIPGLRQYISWYTKNSSIRRAESNLMLKGYLRTKHVQLFKLMMILDVCKDRPLLQFTPELLEEALFYLDGIEVNMCKLSQAAGRNELLSAQQRILDFLLKENRWVELSEVQRMIQSELGPHETFSVIRHLEESEQIVKKTVKFIHLDKPKIGVTLPGLAKQFENNGETQITRIPHNEGTHPPSE